MIDPNDVDEVKQNNRCEDVLREHGVKIDRYGKALCPFHGDKNKSFEIYRKTNTCHCWGCGWDGDVISLTMALNGLSFVEAYKYLGGHTERRNKAEEERLQRKHERLNKWREWIDRVENEIRQIESAVIAVDWEVRDLEDYEVDDKLVALENKKMKLLIDLENYKQSLKVLEKELENEKSNRN